MHNKIALMPILAFTYSTHKKRYQKRHTEREREKKLEIKMSMKFSDVEKKRQKWANFSIIHLLSSSTLPWLTRSLPCLLLLPSHFFIPDSHEIWFCYTKKRQKKNKKINAKLPWHDEDSLERELFMNSMKKAKLPLNMIDFLLIAITLPSSSSSYKM